MAEPCHTCIHYNGGEGDITCYFCDPEFEDRWESEPPEEDEPND